MIVLLCLSVFASTFSFGAFPALLPEIGAGGHLSDRELGMLAAAFGFARVVCDAPSGLVVMRRLRGALVTAPLLMAAGLLLLGSGGPLPVLLTGRALMGAGNAVGIVAYLTAILRYQPERRVSAALNAVELSAMLGFLGGTAFLAALPAHLPWNIALLIAGAPQSLGLAVVPWLIRAVPAGGSAAARPVAAEPHPEARPSSARAVVALAFAAGAVIALAWSAAEQFVIPLRGSRDFGLDRAGVARLLMLAQACDIVALLPVGFLSDRLRIGRVLGVILLVLGAGSALIVAGALPVMVAGCALMGLGMAGWMLPLGVLRGQTPSARIAWRTALYRVTVDGGQFLGPFLGGFLGERLAGLLSVGSGAVLVAIGLVFLVWPAGDGSRRA